MVAHLALFSLLSWGCHQQLYTLKPDTGRLNLYYWIIALGGATAGFFNSLVAPLVFDQLWEYPLSIVLGFGLVLWSPLFRPVWLKLYYLWLFCVLMLGLYTALLFEWWFSDYRELKLIERNFYGVFRVEDHTDGPYYGRNFYHGSLLHGNAPLDVEPQRRAYNPSSSLSFLLYHAHKLERPVAILGMGLEVISVQRLRGCILTTSR